MGRPARDPEERFWERVNIGEEDDCWIREGHRQHSGHNAFTWDGRTGNASRFSLELKEGRKLLPTEYACHICDNPPCVNPNHLYVGNAKTNVQDMMERGRSRLGERATHCKRGHEFTEENTLINVRGHQSCRACDRLRQKERYENNPELQERRRESVRRSKARAKERKKNGTDMV